MESINLVSFHHHPHLGPSATSTLSFYPKCLEPCLPSCLETPCFPSSKATSILAPSFPHKAFSKMTVQEQVFTSSPEQPGLLGFSYTRRAHQSKSIWKYQPLGDQELCLVQGEEWGG